MKTTDSESIATYQESAGGRKVRYTLFPATIHCVGKNPMGMEFDTVVNLNDLRPEYSTTRQYSLYFFYCLGPRHTVVYHCLSRLLNLF